MRIANGVYSPGFHTRQACLSKQLHRAAWGILTVLCLAFASTSAFAACGLMPGAKSVAGITSPALAHADPQLGGLLGEPGNNSFVGLWQTRYVAGGATFAVSFKLWHSDGTELDNIDQNPTLGSVCMGVWKQIGPRTVRLHHVGWVFAPDGTPAGHFELDETSTLAGNGMTYSGSFTFRAYDGNGNYTGTEVTGDVTATRITVN